MNDVATVKTAAQLQVDTIHRRMEEWPAEMLVEVPVIHRFTPGFYIRQVTVKRGIVLVTHTHKTEHPFIVTSGKSLVWSEETGQPMPVDAPFTGITKKGTRRVILVHEDTTWTTFHPNPDNIQDIEVIEDMLFDKLPWKKELK